MDYPDSGDVPGPPIQYEEITPDKGRGGYTFADAGNIGEVDQFFYHGDHLSSVVLVTDSKAKIVQRLAYTPYGEMLLEQSNTDADLPYRFTGKPLDQETGLHYFGARYYDNAACVWLGVDPKWDENVWEGVYVYCSGNPIIFIDPDGRDGKGWVVWDVVDCMVNIVGGACEAIGGATATVGSGGTASGVTIFIMVDGVTRIMLNSSKLITIIGSPDHQSNIPSNLGGCVGKTIDYARGVPENETGAAETIMTWGYDIFTWGVSTGSKGVKESCKTVKEGWNKGSLKTMGKGITEFGSGTVWPVVSDGVMTYKCVSE